MFNNKTSRAGVQEEVWGNCGGRFGDSIHGTHDEVTRNTQVMKQKNQKVLAFTIIRDESLCSLTMGNLGTRKPPRVEGANGQYHPLHNSQLLSPGVDMR
jgi:hypothetical protein